MSFCWWCWCFYALWLKASATESDSWNIEVPHSVIGLNGQCVVIPCLFNYPGPDRKTSSLTGIWFTDSNEKVYHSDASKISHKFLHRTSLMGDLRHRNCSLKINPLQHTDTGPFTFRIEIKDFDKYSYLNHKVSITVKDSPDPPTLSVEEQMKSGKKVTVNCSVLHSCPTDPPHLTWNHQGKVNSQSIQQTLGQWKVMTSLIFTPSKQDHRKSLNCTAVFLRGKNVKTFTTLNVTYPPAGVKVMSRSSVMEGSSVDLNCSSDSNPAAHTYQWFNESKTLLTEGPVYTLKNVNRHTQPLYCTATNTEGKANSKPIQLNVVYRPEIKSNSSCTSEVSTVTCLCMVESHPVSDIRWWGSDPSTVLKSSSTEQHGSLTFATLQGPLNSNTLHCYANNSLGNSTLTLQVPHSGKLVLIAVAITAFLVIIIGLMVWMVKRRCVSSRTEQPAKQTKTDSERRCKVFTTYDESQHVYGNIGLEEEHYPYMYDDTDDEATYANV